MQTFNRPSNYKPASHIAPELVHLSRPKHKKPREFQEMQGTYLQDEDAAQTERHQEDNQQPSGHVAHVSQRLHQRNATHLPVVAEDRRRQQQPGVKDQQVQEGESPANQGTGGVIAAHACLIWALTHRSVVTANDISGLDLCVCVIFFDIHTWWAGEVRRRRDYLVLKIVAWILPSPTVWLTK